MSVITPLIDTLMHSVLGRRAQMERMNADGAENKVLSVNAIRGDQGLKPGQEHLNRPPRAQLDVASERTASAQKGAQEAGLYDRLQPKDQPTAQTPRSVNFRFTQEGQTLSSLLARYGDIKTSVPIATATAPLITPGRPAAPETMAQALRQQVSQSGVFYEAHLAKWFKGEWPTALLRREPQGQLPSWGNTATSASSAAQAGTTPAVAGGALNTPPPSPGALPQAGTVGAGSGAGQAQAATPAGASAASNASLPTTPASMSEVAPGGSQGRADARAIVHDSTHRIISHQLESLTTQTVRFETALTPAYPVMVEITEQRPLPEPDALYLDDEAQGSEGEEAGQWRSSLALTLPALGEMRFDLQLRDGQLHVACAVAKPDTEARVDAERAHLRALLNDAGLDARRIDVARHEVEDDHE